MIKKLSVLFLLAVTACQLTSIKSVPPAETKRVSQEKDERGLTTIEEEEEIINLFRQQKKSQSPKNENHEALSTSKTIEVPQNSENELYKYIYQNWKSQKFDEVLAGTEMLKLKFPESFYIDDCLFMLTKLDFGRERFSEALRGVNELLTHHKGSPLYASSLYLKAQIYKQMGLDGAYESVLNQIVKSHGKTKAAQLAKDELIKIQ